MGIFDLISNYVPELSELGNEIQGLKDEFVSSIMEPTTELRETVSGIASGLTDQANAIAGNASTAAQDVKDAASSVSHSIPIIDRNN